jgi:hypothetical protein
MKGKSIGGDETRARQIGRDRSQLHRDGRWNGHQMLQGQKGVIAKSVCPPVYGIDKGMSSCKHLINSVASSRILIVPKKAQADESDPELGNKMFSPGRIFRLGACSLRQCGSLDPEAERLFAREDIRPCSASYFDSCLILNSRRHLGREILARPRFAQLQGACSFRACCGS